MSYEMYLTEYLLLKEVSVISKNYYALFKTLRLQFPKTIDFIDSNFKSGKQISISRQKIDREIFILKLRSFLLEILSTNSK